MIPYVSTTSTTKCVCARLPQTIVYSPVVLYSPFSCRHPNGHVDETTTVHTLLFTREKPQHQSHQGCFSSLGCCVEEVP